LTKVRSAGGHNVTGLVTQQVQLHPVVREVSARMDRIQANAQATGKACRAEKSPDDLAAREQPWLRIDETSPVCQLQR
jgi:hypothetical protein